MIGLILGDEGENLKKNQKIILWRWIMFYGLFEVAEYIKRVNFETLLLYGVDLKEWECKYSKIKNSIFSH